MRTTILSNIMKRSVHGFTMVEMLLASMILLSGVVFICRGLYTSAGVLKESNLRLQLSSLLQDKICQARMASGKNNSLSGGGEFDLENTRVNYRIFHSVISPAEGLNKLSITAVWEQGEVERRMSYETLFFREG